VRDRRVREGGRVGRWSWESKVEGGCASVSKIRARAFEPKASIPASERVAT